MTQRKAFLTKEQSLMLRGIAIFLVLISHYAVWIGEIFHSDLLEYGLGRFGYFLQCPATGWSKVLEKRESTEHFCGNVLKLSIYRIF